MTRVERLERLTWECCARAVVACALGDTARANHYLMRAGRFDALRQTAASPCLCGECQWRRGYDPCAPGAPTDALPSAAPGRRNDVRP